MRPIEVLGSLILGIHDKRVNGNLGPGGAVDGIPQQGAAEFLAMIV